MGDHALVIPSNGPIHVICGPHEQAAAEAAKTLGVLGGSGERVEYIVDREGEFVFTLMFLTHPDGGINPRAGRAFFDLCGAQVTITGPGAFMGLTETAAMRVVQALSI